MTDNKPAEIEHAVVIMANDAYAAWAERFMRTFRKKNPDTAMFIIPYADDMDKIRQLARDFNGNIFDVDFEKIDDFAAQVFPTEPYKRLRLRKLSVFDLPVKSFIYIDTDVVVLDNISEWFSVNQSQEYDLVYMAKSSDYVYKNLNPEQERKLGKSGLFSSGGFLSGKDVTSSSEIMALITEHADLYKHVRADYVFDQPIINFAFDMMEKRTADIQEISETVGGLTFFKDGALKKSGEEFYFGDSNRKVVAIHWAGSDKTEGSIADALKAL